MTPARQRIHIFEGVKASQMTVGRENEAREEVELKSISYTPSNAYCILAEVAPLRLRALKVITLD
jgi:hypothetical protein